MAINISCHIERPFSHATMQQAVSNCIQSVSQHPYLHMPHPHTRTPHPKPTRCNHKMHLVNSPSATPATDPPQMGHHREQVHVAVTHPKHQHQHAARHQERRHGRHNEEVLKRIGAVQTKPPQQRQPRGREALQLRVPAALQLGHLAQEYGPYGRVRVVGRVNVCYPPVVGGHDGDRHDEATEETTDGGHDGAYPGCPRREEHPNEDKQGHPHLVVHQEGQEDGEEGGWGEGVVHEGGDEEEAGREGEEGDGRHPDEDVEDNVVAVGDAVRVLQVEYLEGFEEEVHDNAAHEQSTGAAEDTCH